MRERREWSIGERGRTGFKLRRKKFGSSRAKRKKFDPAKVNLIIANLASFLSSKYC